MNRARLRWVLLAFVLALAVPTAFLISHAYGQLKWEAFHQYRMLAEETARRIDREATRLFAGEEARGFTDYRFLSIDEQGRAGFRQRSPLSAFPVQSDIPGLIGWFQVDANGALSTPLLPHTAGAPVDDGIDPEERVLRADLEARIQSILSANRLVGARQPRAAPASDRAPAPAPASLTSDARVALADRGATAGRAGNGADKDAAERDAPTKNVAAESQAAAPQPRAQAAFDELSNVGKLAARRKQAPVGPLGRVDDLQLSSPYAASVEEKRQAKAEAPMREALKQRAARKELEAAGKADFIAAAPPVTGLASGLPAITRILTFESELDPFEFNLLDSGHFVLYRKVWREGQRYIQGALIEQQPFLAGLVRTAFDDTALSRMSKLVVAWQGNVFAAFAGDSDGSRLASSEELTGALLYRTRLSAPLADLELVFSVTRLPAGPGASVIVWTAGVLALVLVIGAWLMYRLGARQLDLARQQQDFVAAVSHELRTPITSIRMYAEMLQEGWASEEKKRGYYEFIVQESERLSRLIANVLQLARMSRNDVAVQLHDIGVAQLLDGVRSKLSSQVQHAGFELQFTVADAAAGRVLQVDPDAFSQCLINLVDNALKFSAGAARKVVEIGGRVDSDDRLNVTVRDFGPGVARDQMKKIFTLFYRSGDELTRETVGTGIGLALVHQLMRAMHGEIEVANADPGAVFTLRFPCKD